MLPEEDPAAAIGNEHKKLKIGRVVPEICSRTDRHTVRQTDTLITILRSPTAQVSGRGSLAGMGGKCPVTEREPRVVHEKTTASVASATLICPCRDVHVSDWQWTPVSHRAE